MKISIGYHRHMEFIANTPSKGHRAALSSAFSAASEIWISVDYLKMSGLVQIKKEIREHCRKKRKIEIYCGLDQYITEPEALRSLRA